MAKKKKKKGDKTPYVHIDIEPEQEQSPSAQTQPGVPNAAQGGQTAHGNQASADDSDGSHDAPFVIPVFHKSDARQGMSGAQPMPNGMYGTGQFPPVAGGFSNGNPRQNLAQIQQNLLSHHNVAQQQANQHSMQPGMGQPMQQGMSPMAQQPAQAAQQAAAQAAAQAAVQQQAAQQAAAEAAVKQQAAQQAAAEAVAKQKVAQQAAAQQKAAQEAAAQQAAMQQVAAQRKAAQQAAAQQAAAQQRAARQAAAAKQATGQFGPVANQAQAKSQGQPQQQPTAQPRQQNPRQQMGRSMKPGDASMAGGAQGGQDILFSAAMGQRHQGVQPQGTLPTQQGTMQSVASAAAARAAQSRTAATQAAMQSAAQARQASQQAMRQRQSGNASIGIGAQQGIAGAQASPYQQRQAATPTVQPHASQAVPTQAVAGTVPQYQATQSSASAAPASSAPDASVPDPQAAKNDKAPTGNVGDPLLDSKAIEESSMFDEPPVPLEEGMRKSKKGHKARTRVIVIIAILAVLIGGGIVGYMLLSEQGVVPRISIETATVPVSPQGSSGASGSSSSASNAADPSAVPDTPAGGDLSGTVVYEYSANTASGVEYKVKETVTFQSNGDCQSSTMDMTFPDEASAKTFTDNLARDYGTSFKLDSLNGNNAVVTIDNSGLHLTRDEYENALRYSVSDLVVTK